MSLSNIHYKTTIYNKNALTRGNHNEKEILFLGKRTFKSGQYKTNFNVNPINHNPDTKSFK